ncbi:unnamed protein product [Caenorhabditis sp. 36 PRJEB53466]|nr:unnamed protein product [Caenorhabditis sp. 36 PRJEB53466]
MEILFAGRIALNTEFFEKNDNTDRDSQGIVSERINHLSNVPVGFTLIGGKMEEFKHGHEAFRGQPLRQFLIVWLEQEIEDRQFEEMNFVDLIDEDLMSYFTKN